MHYQEGDPRFDWRLAYFRAMVWPLIQNQTRKDFDVAIRCNEWQEPILKRINPSIITFHTKKQLARYRLYNGKRYFYDFCKWKDVVGLPQYDIQSGLDSDDLIRRDYIERVREEIDKATPGESLHVSFQPMLFNSKTFEQRSMTTRYGSKKGSAFLTLYQPNKRNYKFIYEESHLTIGGNAQRSIIIPEGYCWATAHGINESTGK
jgi:hypothetical protein